MMVLFSCSSYLKEMAPHCRFALVQPSYGSFVSHFLSVKNFLRSMKLTSSDGASYLLKERCCLADYCCFLCLVLHYLPRVFEQSSDPQLKSLLP